MMKFRENEDAVSPVIGVILMAAITVILAAVIAAFVFGMTDNIKPQKEVTVTASQGVFPNGTPNVNVKIFGGKDVNLLIEGGISVNINDNHTGNLTGNTTGSSETFKLDKGQNTVTVVARFADGTQQIVLDKVFTVA